MCSGGYVQINLIFFHDNNSILNGVAIQNRVVVVKNTSDPRRVFDAIYRRGGLLKTVNGTRSKSEGLPSRLTRRGLVRALRACDSTMRAGKEAPSAIMYERIVQAGRAHRFG